MKYTSVDIQLVIDTFLLLLIGIGPKIALVPFLDLTADMDNAIKRRVSRKMLVTAGGVAVVLVVLGELLSRLLHFSTGSLSVAGGIILVIISIRMVLGSEDPVQHRATEAQNPMRMAVFPLAVPYLLNPAGVVALVTISAEADSVAVFGTVLGLLGRCSASTSSYSAGPTGSATTWTRAGCWWPKRSSASCSPRSPSSSSSTGFIASA